MNFAGATRDEFRQFETVQTLGVSEIGSSLLVTACRLRVLRRVKPPGIPINHASQDLAEHIARAA
jgi:hypothetical protein